MYSIQRFKLYPKIGGLQNIYNLKAIHKIIKYYVEQVYIEKKTSL